MTTANQAREIILGRFITVWDALDPAVPYTFDNEDYEPPNGAGDQSWCALMIRESIGGQETLGPVGARRYRRNGSANLEIFALRNKGSQKADSLVQTFRNNFEGVTLSASGNDVYFTDCQVQEVGIEGAWYRVNAFASFWFEETK